MQFMTIQESVEIIFQQLEDSLSGAAIVGHVRHVLEMFVCLQQGYETGMVNYEKRKRDNAIESCRQTAIGLFLVLFVPLYEKKVIITKLISPGFQRKANGSANIFCTAHMNSLIMRFNNMFADSKA